MKELNESRFEFTVSESQRLDKALTELFSEFSRMEWLRAIQLGQVQIEGQVAKPGIKLKVGWKVSGSKPVERTTTLSPASIELEIAYEDDYLVVPVKPRGLPTHPAPSYHGPTLVNALLGRSGGLSDGTADYRPGIVHRLDKDTAGLLVVAKTNAIHRKLAGMILNRTLARKYLVVVEGELPRNEFTVDGPIGRDPNNRIKMAVVEGGKEARTHLTLLSTSGSLHLLEAKLETGRTHQIRVHLASIGMPVVGDKLYNPAKSDSDLQLHAWKLQFDHPVIGKELRLVSLPDDQFLLAP